MRDRFARNVADAGRPRGMPTTDTDTLEEVSRADVARERCQRLHAEARAADAERRAQLAEERAAIAEWLVALLRSEVSGAAPERRHWWWPWRRHARTGLWAHPEDVEEVWGHPEVIRRQSRP